MKADAEGRQEIIIVRRGGHDEDEGHHGGAWKIAFADFMTAMMCFFLVMWLINAANEQTRAALASYFNPVKLIDRNTNRKGIGDLEKGPENSSETGEEDKNPAAENAVGTRRTSTQTAKVEDTAEESKVAPYTDDNLFADPYAVLSEIAGDTENQQNISSKGDGGAQVAGPADGAQGGESYRDPFAPDFWSSQIEIPQEAENTAKPALPEGPIAADQQQPPPEHVAILDDPFAPKAELDDPFAPKAEGEIESDVTLEEVVAGLADSDARSGMPKLAQPAPNASALQPVAPKPVIAKAAPVDKMEPATLPQEDQAEAKHEQLAADIRKELSKALGGIAQEGLSVVATETGVLISVADSINDGMFEIGSAVPRHDLVVAMTKIGNTLRQRKGTVTINGHTDGRPFAGKEYDNWRLSTARAHATYYMLVRGGLDEKRVTAVAGYADRRLKVPDEPFASANRRIEILLETAG